MPSSSKLSQVETISAPVAFNSRELLPYADGVYWHLIFDTCSRFGTQVVVPVHSTPCSRH